MSKHIPVVLANEVVASHADAREDGRFIVEASDLTAPPSIPEIIDTFARKQWKTIDPNRPFTGQPHTDQGVRGMAYVEGIRFRDLADCLVKAFAESCAQPDMQQYLAEKIANGSLEYNDLYKIDLSQIDPVAVIQNLTCNVEKIMEIFPNLPDLDYVGDNDERSE